MSNSISRRSGGRTARRTARSAPLAEHLRPVKAGMVGGSYSPLSSEGEKKYIMRHWMLWSLSV